MDQAMKVGAPVIGINDSGGTYPRGRECPFEAMLQAFSAEYLASLM